MTDRTFTILYEKLGEALDQEAPEGPAMASEAEAAEISEIDELRRLVLEITEPEPTSYTMS